MTWKEFFLTLRACRLGKCYLTRDCISDKWRSGLSFCNFTSSLVPLQREVKDCLGSHKAETEFLRENYFCVSPVIKDFLNY